MKSVFLAALFSALFISQSHAKAPVWKVSKGDDFIYLGGTIHMLSDKDYPLPQAFQEAYANTDNVVLETDIRGLEAPELQGRILEAISYQDHRGLSNVLTRDVYKQLEEVLKSRGLPIAVLDKLTPFGAMMTVTQIELQRLGLIGVDGVDLHFTKRAEKDEKPRLSLETVEEQLVFMHSMNDLDPDTVIKSGIEELENMQNVWSGLVSAWRLGDLKQLETMGIDDMKSQFPNMYQTMLVQRNKAWLGDIEALMTNQDKEFVLVGALHMAGEEGLITQLAKRGYTIIQLD